MRRALAELSIRGVKTTVPLLEEILRDERFLSGNYDTGFLDARNEKAKTNAASDGEPKKLAAT
jgi:pyruvate carboxylase